jgi:hypothetical protein
LKIRKLKMGDNSSRSDERLQIMRYSHWKLSFHYNNPPVMTGISIYVAPSVNPSLQWPKEKGQNDKEWSTTYYTKTRWRNINALKTENERMCSGRVNSSCSTSGTRRSTLGKISVLKEEKDKTTTCGTYMWSYVIEILPNG